MVVDIGDPEDKRKLLYGVEMKGREYPDSEMDLGTKYFLSRKGAIDFARKISNPPTICVTNVCELGIADEKDIRKLIISALSPSQRCFESYKKIDWEK